MKNHIIITIVSTDVLLLKLEAVFHIFATEQNHELVKSHSEMGLLGP